jgi:hypothetical protein
MNENEAAATIRSMTHKASSVDGPPPEIATIAANVMNAVLSASRTRESQTAPRLLMMLLRSTRHWSRA